QYPAALLRNVQRQGHGFSIRCRNKHRNGAAPTAISSDVRSDVGRFRMKTHYAPKTHAHLLTEWDGIAGQHGRPCLTGQKRQQQSYRALADHKYEFIREATGFVDRLQARVDGLDKGWFLKRDVI